MGTITKAFKSGNSVAVRLPKELGIVEGMELVVGRNGTTVTIRPKRKGTMADLVAENGRASCRERVCSTV